VHNRRSIRAGVLLVAILAFHDPAIAGQQPSQGQGIASLTIDQLMTVDVQRVEGASKFLQEVVNAPAAVTVVTHDEIRQYGYRTLADLLQGVGGLYVSNDRNYSYVGVRGFSRPGDYNVRVLLLVDGHRVNDNIFDQALIGTEFPLDLSLIDRVEIIRGPGSSLYGTNAMFGVINIVTRRAPDVEAMTVSADAGSLETMALRATGARTFRGGADVLVSATAYTSAGQRQLFFPGLAASTPTRGISSNADQDRLWNVFGRATGKRWAAEVVWGSRTKEIPTGAFDTALGDPRSRTIDQRGYVDLRYENDWKGATITWRGAYDRYLYDGTYAARLENGPDPDPIRDYGHGDWLTTETMVARHVGRAHLLTGGFELRDNIRQNQGEYQPLSGPVYLNDRRSSLVWSTYLEDEITISPRVLVNLGVRHDDHHPFVNAVSPRVALIVKPRPQAALKLLYGSAFRAPNAYELFYFTPAGANLDAERIRSFEAIWEQYFSRRVRISAEAFVYSTRNLITQIPADTIPDGLAFANIDKAHATGLELEAEGTLGKGMRASASYTLADGTGANDVALSNSPRHLAQLRLTVPAGPGGLRAGIEGVLMGDRLTVSGRSTGAVQLWNVTLLQANLLRRGSLTLGVRNLFNRAYANPGGSEHPDDLIPQDGRTLRVRFGWHF
jgi:outer membrane receptor protein involved in Fe transport